MPPPGGTARGAVAALGAGAATASLLAWLRLRLHTIAIEGDSMRPALEPDDWVVARRGPPPRGDRARGAIVTAREPGGRLLVKRIVGLPGEHLRLEHGLVCIDGAALDEPYARGPTLEGSAGDDFPLGRDQYFLLGDHRQASTDSRAHGPLSRDRIEGVVSLRYWPFRRAGRV